MIYPANPVHFKARTQLRGLERGDFILMPKWDGRRAVYIPKRGLWYKSGKPCDARPWKDLSIPRTDVCLDVELMRDRVIVLDIIAPGLTLEKRFQKAEELGLEIMYFNISGANEVKEYFRKCRHSGICDGVVMKRKNSYYPICNIGQANHLDWVKVKDESIHLLG